MDLLPRQRIVESPGNRSVRTQRDPVRTPARRRAYSHRPRGAGVPGEYHPRINIGSGRRVESGLGSITEPACKHEDQQQCSKPRPSMRSNQCEQKREPPPNRPTQPRTGRAKRRSGVPDHGITRSRSASSFVGPIPDTASSPSTVSKSPSRSRWSTIAAASEGPIPGRPSNVAGVAVESETGPPAVLPVVTGATGDDGSAHLLADQRHPDPLTVAQHLRKVERVTVGIEGKAACGIDGVRYPSTDTKLVNARMQDRTVDMHDDDRRKRRGPRIA